MPYSTEALGQVIRDLRTKATPKLTQEQLGKAAEYGAGAGVSISRIESGQMRPGPDKLELIAQALHSTGARVEMLAEQRTQELVVAAGATKTDSSSRAVLPVKQRLTELQRTIGRRTTKVTELAEAFNAAHDRARDEFFLKFIEDARQVAEAPPPPDPGDISDDDLCNPATAAQFRLELTSSGVAKALATFGGAGVGLAAGGAAAYATFTATAMLGTASTGVAISGLSGVAATNATLALLGGGTLASGGAGIAGGTRLLAGIVAAPAAVLAVGGFVWMARRSKQKEAELRHELDLAEAEIAETQRGFDALIDALSRATGTLDYIGIHAAHAEHRWRAALLAGSTAWSAMSPEAQRGYQDFIAIAGCQLSVARLSAEAYLSARGSELEALIRNTDEVLARADETVKALV